MAPKLHTTNYVDTFIEVAEDCPVKVAEIPPSNDDKKTIANMQFDMPHSHPYIYTSDEVIFMVYAERNNIPKKKYATEMKKFFSKGQPCLRSSPLTKRYGWGVHNNEREKIAIYPVESDQYKKLAKDKKLKHVKAMSSKKR